MPQAVAATFVGDDDTGDPAALAPAPTASHGGFVLANARDDLVSIAHDLGVVDHPGDKNAVTDKDPRVTVRLRSLLDQISVTLQGRELRLLEQETAENDNGTNVTNMAALCRHADELIDGLKGSSRQSSTAAACVMQ